MKPAVRVAITSDLMCPWCWVGLKKLQRASKHANINLDIEWKPFLLRPNLPEEGVPKGGTPQSRVGARLKQAGDSVGIDFTGLTERTPNTILFHSVMKMIQEDDDIDRSVATEFQEAVFERYFTLGVYPDMKGLLEAAHTVNDKTVLTKMKTMFDDHDGLNKLRKQVIAEAEAARAGGVHGVPSFEFNGQFVFSGAQPEETFVHYLRQFS